MMAKSFMSQPQYTAAFYFAKKFRLLLGLVLFLTVVTTALESISLVAFFPLFSSVLGNDGNDTTGILKMILDLANLLPIEQPVVAASVLLVAIFLTKTFLSLFREILVGYTSATVLYRTKKEVLETFVDAHYQYFLDNNQGELLYRTLSAPGHVAAVISMASTMVLSILKIGSISVVLIAIFPVVGIGVVILGLVYYGLVHYLSKRVSLRLGTEKVTVGMDETVLVNEFLSGFRQNITLNVTKWWLNRFDQRNSRMRVLSTRESAWLAIPKPVMELSTVFLMIGFVFFLWLSDPDGVKNNLAAAGLFGIALVQIMPPLTSLSSTRMSLMSAIPNLQVTYEIIKGPVPMRVKGAVVLNSFEKSINFTDVNFGYSGRNELFHQLNLTFEKGSVTGIVGASGSGKTTIINLILGLFQPSNGKITVDGHEIQELTDESWLNRIGFVSQDLFSYHASVEDNIVFGRSIAEHEMISEAAQIANADEFITTLPEGYGTIVGERGLKLSGGQQQRLAIARAVLNRPDILIFDEATSSLDTVSERSVQEAIDNVSVDRTVIIIAHRLSTVRHADKIIVLDEGKVVEEGSHEDLLKNQGHYYSLLSLSN